MALESSDRTFYSVADSICTQCQICFSIVTACIPVTKPFLDGFASGMLGNSLRHKIPRNAQATKYYMNTLPGGRHGHRPQSNDAIEDESQGAGLNLGSSAAAVGAESDIAKADLTRRFSISSMRSDQMIINRTDQWSVRYEDHSELSNETLHGPSQAGHSTV